MQSIIVSRILKTLSLLPLSLWYAFADILFVLQKYVIKYRRETVLENMRNSFPQNSEKENEKLYEKFTRHFCDYVVEGVKSLGISQKEMDKCIEIEGLEVLDQIKARGQNTMMLCGHIFNWEWLMGIVAHLPVKNTYAVYHELSNKTMDKLIKDSRGKFNTELVAMRDTTRKLLSIPNDGNSGFLFVSDQSPASSKIHYDLTFLNQETPVFTGFDRLARKLNCGVVYMHITKEKRGRFKFKIMEIKPGKERFKELEIVDEFYRLLEENIKQDPSNWLWTHRRWKYKKGIDY